MKMMAVNAFTPTPSPSPLILPPFSGYTPDSCIIYSCHRGIDAWTLALNHHSFVDDHRRLLYTSEHFTLLLVGFSKENIVTGDERIITCKQDLNPGSLMYTCTVR